MKRLYVAILLLLICLSISLIECTNVINDCKKCTNLLENAEYYFSEKEYSSAEESCKKAQTIWENEVEKLNTFLVHGVVDRISENLSLLCMFADNKNHVEFNELCNKTKRQLLLLKKSELPLFENIL